MYKILTKLLYFQSIIHNTMKNKYLQSELEFNSFNGCQNNGLSNITDSNITNALRTIINLCGISKEETK